MNLILFDSDSIRKNLLPFTFTRPVAEIRIGINTIAQKWERAFSSQPSYLTPDYLAKKFPLKTSPSNWVVNGAVCPNAELLAAIENLKDGEALVKGGILLAGKCDSNTLAQFKENLEGFNDYFQCKPYNSTITILQNLWDIFEFNGDAIRHDFELITKDRTSQKINDPHTKTYNSHQIFIEEGAKIKAAVLNAEAGPIYIGKNAEVMEGSFIRGPFAACENSTVNMGTKVRGDTTIGPYSKVGGEISNVVIFGYSNKSHDGFLGNAVIGEWCNLGAATNASNLKNTYGSIKLWNYAHKKMIDSGRQFCGLIMGDHSRCGINTMFNTGTVVGVGTNVYGAGFPPKFIPSFSWGAASGGGDFSTYQLDKFLATARIMMQRRNKIMDIEEEKILTHIFEQTVAFRAREI